LRIYLKKPMKKKYNKSILKVGTFIGIEEFKLWNKKEVKIKHCRYCGTKMNIEVIPASKVVERYGFDCIRPYRDFNENTGNRKFGLRYSCPNDKWYQQHDNFTELLIN